MLNKKGSIIIFALITMGLIVVASLAMARVTLQERTGAALTSNSTTAFQTSDAGVELFLQQIYRNLHELKTLSDLATEITGSDTCIDGSISVSVTDGSFELIPIGINATDSNLLGEPLTDCDSQLADIAHFKVVGEHRDAVRAIQLKIRDSLTRGLLAHWNLEDNVDAIAGGGPGSAFAKDSSKNTNNLTLCPLDEDNHYNPPVLPDENFDYCHHYKDDDTASDVWMDHGSSFDRGSAWGGESATGIVNETPDVGDVVCDPGDSCAQDVPHGQALTFNGTSNYLTPNTYEISVDPTLGLPDTVESFSLSLWFKGDGSKDGDRQTLVAKTDGSSSDGFELYITTTERVAFRTDGMSGTIESGTGLLDGEWHHIVISMDLQSDVTADQRAKIYVDGAENDRASFTGSDRSSEPLMIGGRYTESDGDQEFDPLAFPGPAVEDNHGFAGQIDDIRIYDRGLTSSEIDRLCEMAKSSWSGACS